jgi:hypothetical protein
MMMMMYIVLPRVWEESNKIMISINSDLCLLLAPRSRPAFLFLSLRSPFSPFSLFSPLPFSLLPPSGPLPFAPFPGPSLSSLPFSFLSFSSLPLSCLFRRLGVRQLERPLDTNLARGWVFQVAGLRVAEKESREKGREKEGEGGEGGRERKGRGERGKREKKERGGEKEKGWARSRHKSMDNLLLSSHQNYW